MKKLLISLLASLLTITAMGIGSNLLAHNASGGSCAGGSFATPATQNPPLINAIETYAQALGGTKIWEVDQLKPGDIFIRTNWYGDAQIEQGILKGHSAIYSYEAPIGGDITENGEPYHILSTQVVELRRLDTEAEKNYVIKFGSLREDDFNIIADNPEVPQVKYLHIYNGHDDLMWDSRFTRKSAFIYKLNVTQPQLDTAVAAEMSRIREIRPTYGIYYNCHDFVCNVLQNLKYPE